MNVLFVGAHPDDIETFAGGTAARYRDRGDNLFFCVATNGNVGSSTLSPEEIATIRHEEAKAGAAVVATGRSDFPNQVNNSTGFPGIFRGTLDVRAKTITDEMCIAAAMELAKVAQDRGLKDDYITPTMDDWEIFPREAVAVAMKAQEQGIARITTSRDELYKNAMAIIKHARDEVQLLMKEGLIAPYNE